MRSLATTTTGGVALDPLSAGTTTINAAAPSFTTVPQDTEVVTVN